MRRHNIPPLGVQRQLSLPVQADRLADVIWIQQSGKNADLLASGSHDARLLLWDLETGAIHKELKGHTGVVQALAHKGNYLASGTWNSEAGIWSLDNDKNDKCVLLKGHTGTVWSLCFLETDEQLASASSDKTIRIWKTQQEKAIAQLQGHNGAVYGIQYDASGKRLFSVSGDGTFRVWDLAQLHWDLDPKTEQIINEKELYQHSEQHPGKYRVVALSPKI